MQVHSYAKCHRRTFESFDSVPLHGLPPVESITTALWLRLGDAISLLLDPGDTCLHPTTKLDLQLSSGLHGANHALKIACCLLLDCDPADICCEHESKELRLLIYDAAVGGTGLAWQAFCRIELLIATAVGLLEECICTNGCPSCIFTAEAGCYDDAICKRSALSILRNLIAIIRE